MQLNGKNIGKMKFIFSFLTFFILLLGVEVHALEYNVTKTEDTNDGVCDTDCSLREAIVESNNNSGRDTIFIPNGIYNQTILGSGEISSATGDLNIKDDLIIIGSGVDTILVGSDSDRVLYVDPFDVNLTVEISSLSIKDGNSSYGGGILNNGTLTLNSVVITGNKAINGGGILSTGPLILNNTTVIANQAQTNGSETNGFGGGVWLSTKSCIIINSMLDSNNADRSGGAIYTGVDNVLSITNSRFNSNISGQTGGAMSINGNMEINSSLFENNIGNDGGAIAFLATSTARILDTNFISNQAQGIDLGGGGALFIYGANVTINSSSFDSNTALGEGGGAIENTGNLVIIDSELNNNQALFHDAIELPSNTAPGFGGAILLIDGASTTLSNITMNYNNAANSGGGIYNDWNSLLDIDYSDLSFNNAERLYGGAISNNGILKITGSTLTFNKTKLLGGAISTARGSVDLLHTQIKNNDCNVSGGGIYNGVGTEYFSISNSIISENTALSRGGGIHNQANLTIDYSEISRNHSMEHGGGLNNDTTGIMDIDHSTIAFNTSDMNGGGIWNTNIVNVKRSDINNNLALDLCGGIGNSNATFTLFESTVKENNATDGGGIGNLYAGELDINNSTIYNNTAIGSSGGGILNFKSILSIINSTMSANNANIGANISNRYIEATVLLSHSTIVKSTKTSTASEIYNFEGSIEYLNTMIYGNCDNQGTMTSQGGNLESPNNSCNFEQINDQNLVEDLLINPLQNNGGRTSTHALMEDSPALASGDSLSCLQIDQRGSGRINCDIGSFEKIEDITTISGIISYTLLVDEDGNSQINKGDTVHISVEISNQTGRIAKEVSYENPIINDSTLTVGSVTTTQGQIAKGNTLNDLSVLVALGDMSDGDTSIITFDILIDKPVGKIVMQGDMFGNNVIKQKTNSTTMQIISPKITKNISPIFYLLL